MIRWEPKKSDLNPIKKVFNDKPIMTDNCRYLCQLKKKNINGNNTCKIKNNCYSKNPYNFSKQRFERNPRFIIWRRLSELSNFSYINEIAANVHCNKIRRRDEPKQHPKEIFHGHNSFNSNLL